MNHLIDALRYIVTKLKGGGKVSLDIDETIEDNKQVWDKGAFVDEPEPVDINDPMIWDDM
jgi:hypothetical protein